MLSDVKFCICRTSDKSVDQLIKSPGKIYIYIIFWYTAFQFGPPPFASGKGISQISSVCRFDWYFLCTFHVEQVRKKMMDLCCLQGQLCGLCLLFSPSGKMIWICRMNENQCELLRITINTMIFGHLCHLALDHWRGGTLLFCCFCVILGDSWWFTNNSEISFGAIPGDLQTTLKFLLGNSQWYSVICEPLWNSFGVILSYLQTTLKFLWSDS